MAKTKIEFIRVFFNTKGIKMEPLNAITAALTSVKTATDIAKLLKDSDLSLEKAELKLKLADLMDALSEAKIKIADFKEVIREKEDTIRKLQQSLDIKANLEWESPYYWFIDGNNKDGPFCQHCWDDKEKLVRLQNFGQGRWECKTCKNVYHDRDYRPINFNRQVERGF